MTEVAQAVKVIVINILYGTDLEQREDAARVNKENDEMAAKNLQAEVS